MSTFGAVFWAEQQKLLSRPLARAGLVLLAIIGALGPVAMFLLVHSGISTGGVEGEMQGISDTMDVSAANAVRWSLYLRNFFVIHVLLTVLAAMSYAGELQARTLREDLVRPVPRSVVLLAKWASLGGWALAGLALELVASAALGALLHPLAGDDPDSAQWGPVLAGHLVSWISEIGFAAVVLCAAVLVRSVAGTLLSVFLFLVFEQGLAWVLAAVGGIVRMMPVEPQLGPVKALLEVEPFLPSSAWAVWTEVTAGIDPSWQPWTALAVYTVLAVVLADRVFARTDVP